MSSDDIRFAKEHMEWGDDNINECVKEFKHIDEHIEYNFPDDEFHGGSSLTQIDESKLSCIDCGGKFLSNSASALHTMSTKVLTAKDDENEAMLKHLQKAQNEGLSIDYRCPRCHSCNDLTTLLSSRQSEVIFSQVDKQNSYRQ